MLTYNKNKPHKIKRTDKPWLLFILAIIWVFGTVFFHSPWEPYEPFVFAVVKGIVSNNSWFVPYISGVPYAEIQPFYFWFYASIIKLFNITDINYIANTIRIINTLIIFGVLFVMGRVGSGLVSFKSGRTTILILISMFGFVNVAYKLSPDILILFGMSLYLYALQKYKTLPGISSWILFLGLLFLSIHFTCEFLFISIITLFLLPILDDHWRNVKYFITTSIGLLLFMIIFYLYCIQLQHVNIEFFHQWKSRYFNLFKRDNYNFWIHTYNTLQFLLWYVAPGWVLMFWSIWKRRDNIFQDKTIEVGVVLFILFFIFACISGNNPEDVIFPVILIVPLIGAMEVDSIKITIVSFFNSFSIIAFGFIGFLLWIGYFILNIPNVHNKFFRYIISIAQDYKHHFHAWQILLATLITVIWLIMITRRHIRGREMVTNWACGSTFVLILSLALWLPWFDSVLTFKPIVDASLKYLNKNKCIATNQPNSTQMALWYYYHNINLIPTFINLNNSICNQGVVATENPNIIDEKEWRIVWMGRRPIDRKIYYVIKHK